MQNILTKFRGQAENLPPFPKLKIVIVSFFGAFLAGSTLGFLAFSLEYSIIMGSFGASIFLVMAAPDSPFAQPRNVIFGHFLASLIGLSCLYFVGDSWWSMALALAITTSVMLILRISHPPACSNPVAIFIIIPEWGFLWAPTLLGAFLVTLIALIYHNLASERVYPKYW